MAEFTLPYNLKESEEQFTRSTINYLKNSNNEKNLLSISLKFDGIRLNPIISRLSDSLLQNNFDNILLWSDAGGAALAKRDMPQNVNKIFTYKDYSVITEDLSNKIIIAISPQPYDIDEFEAICMHHNSSVIMFNGKLEDPAVGIGSVGRDRRKRFNNMWKIIYYLEPLSKGAIIRNSPENWLLFGLQEDGYIFRKQFTTRPDDETIIMNI